MTTAVRPKVRDDLSVVELDGEAVIYDARGSDVLHLNPTATIVFNLCDGTATVKEMAADISAAFRIPSAHVEREVRSLLRDFRKSSLLEGSLVPEHRHTAKSTDDQREEEAAQQQHDERRRTRQKKPTST